MKLMDCQRAADLNNHLQRLQKVDTALGLLFLQRPFQGDMTLTCRGEHYTVKVAGEEETSLLVAFARDRLRVQISEICRQLREMGVEV